MRSEEENLGSGGDCYSGEKFGRKEDEEAENKTDPPLPLKKSGK
uniref:Uncharacterized protein n=1 Tax=Arundo donax TaxID=35708 RepID=A0A0A9ATU6_ARUDO